MPGITKYCQNCQILEKIVKAILFANSRSECSNRLEETKQPEQHNQYKTPVHVITNTTEIFIDVTRPESTLKYKQLKPQQVNKLITYVVNLHLALTATRRGRYCIGAKL